MYRNTTTISYQELVEDMYHSIGVTDDGFKKMFTVDPSAKHNINLKPPQSPSTVIVEYHRHHNKPGERLDDIVLNRINPLVDSHIRSVIEGTSPSIVGTSDDETTVSLLHLCTDVFLRSTTTSFLGEKIWDVSPNFLEYFEVWERENWKYMFKMPPFISGDMIEAKDGLINSFIRYLALPADERCDSNDFAKDTESLMRDAGLINEDIARIFMLHFWA